MIILRQSRLFKQVIIAVYGVALLFCLLSFAGSLFAEGVPFRWQSAIGFALASALFAWRLWLYRRALGVGGPAPPARRFVLVYLPLGLLAMAGLVAALLGLAWVGIGIWFVLEPASVATLPMGPAGEPGVPVQAAVPIVSGLLVAALGVALTFPLFRILLRRPAVIAPMVDADDPAEAPPTA